MNWRAWLDDLLMFLRLAGLAAGVALVVIGIVLLIEFAAH